MYIPPGKLIIYMRGCIKACVIVVVVDSDCAMLDTFSRSFGFTVNCDDVMQYRPHTGIRCFVMGISVTLSRLTRG